MKKLNRTESLWHYDRVSQFLVRPVQRREIGETINLYFTAEINCRHCPHRSLLISPLYRGGSFIIAPSRGESKNKKNNLRRPVTKQKLPPRLLLRRVAWIFKGRAPRRPPVDACYVPTNWFPWFSFAAEGQVLVRNGRRRFLLEQSSCPEDDAFCQVSWKF